MDWFTALTNFTLIAEEKSFSKAAQQRYASSSALSKQVSWLEYQLKTRLIQRSTRQFALTQAGQLLYQRSKILINDFNDLKSSLSSAQECIEGHLKIAAPLTFGEQVLIKHLPVFKQRYPHIKLELELSNHYHDLINESIDVAIRAGDTREKSLSYHELKAEPRGLFASPQYLKTSPHINTLDDLQAHACLAHNDFKPSNIWRFKQQSVQIHIPIRKVYVTT